MSCEDNEKEIENTAGAEPEIGLNASDAQYQQSKQSQESSQHAQDSHQNYRPEENQSPPNANYYGYAPPHWKPHSQQFGYQPEQKSAKNAAWILPLAAAIGCLPWAVIFLLIIALGSMGMSGSSKKSNESHVAVVRITGVIQSGKGGGLLEDSSGASESIVNQLERARKNKSAKAVLVRIDSPGGAPAASEEIYQAIKRVRESGKPVYASMGDVAASGGYMVASACDKIYAGPSTMTGSIGVIIETPELSGLFKKIGVNPQTITAGKFKDIGSPNRPMTEEERQLLKTMINDVYERFIELVAEGRRLPIETIRKAADGRIYTGRQAKQAKLVDELGGMMDAAMDIKKAAGLNNSAELIEYRKDWLESLFGGGSSTGVEEIISRIIMRKLAEQSTAQPVLR